MTRLAAPLLILAAMALAWRAVPGLGLYGWDTYPLIASGHFESASELLGNLGEELMEGQFPGGRYWRPLVHLSVGLDHAAWGLDALGYRLTDLAILALTALGVHSLFLQLIGSRAGALVAGLAYAVHPLHWELLPLPARRADALCALFTVLALRAVAGTAPPGAPKREQRSLGPWPHAGPWVAPWVALFSALAMASKETGVLAVPLCALLVWLAHLPFGADGSPRVERSGLRAALRATWPAWLVLALYLALRTWILGGVGGGPRASLGGAFTSAGEFALRYGILLAYPVPFLGAVPAERVLAAVAVVLALALGWLLSTTRPGDGGEGPSEGLRGARRTTLLAVVWLVLVLLVTSASGVQRSWYGVAFLPPWCLLLGVLAALAQGALARGRGPQRASWSALVVAILALALCGPLVVAIPPEKRASADAAEELLARFETAVESTRPGETVTVDARPPGEAAVRHGQPTARPVTFPPYGLEAYARLRWPDRRVRCEVAGDAGAEPAAADEVVVQLISR